jgi:hypothetical protein
VGELERESILSLTSLFAVGEEAVTLDLLPLVLAIARESRMEEKELCLTSVLFEEGKHTELFARFLSEIAGSPAARESRHIAYGVYLLSRLVASDAATWDVVEARMNERFPFALGGVTPFGLEQSKFLDFATTQFAKRYERISRACGKTLSEIDALAEAETDA